MDKEIDLRKYENQKIYKNLKGRILFFSCCQIGSEIQVMRKILKYSKAEAIFSYADFRIENRAIDFPIFLNLVSPLNSLISRHFIPKNIISLFIFWKSNYNS